MASLYLPQSAVRKLKADQEQYSADVVAGLALRNTMDRWNRELKQIDDRLELVRAQEKTTVPGLRPGYWHVLRVNPAPSPPSLIALEGEGGEFREPGSWMFEMLRAADLWRDDVARDRARRKSELEVVQRRARERERAELREELADRWKARTNPGVSMAGTGWRYRAGARRS